MPTKPIEELKAQVGDSNETVRDLAVEAGKVEEFARAIGDDNPVYRGESAAAERGYSAVPAPITFTRTNYFPRYRPEGIDNSLGFDLGLRSEYLVHGEHEYQFERPVYVGDVLSGETTLSEVYQREGSRGGTMTFLVYETRYRDRDDELVLTERMTRIETGGAIDESGDDGTERGTEETDTATDGGENTVESNDEEGPVRPDGDVSVGDAGPEVVAEDIERQDFVRYAGASGDFNPIHYDEPYAKAAGNPSVFAQGMLTAGYASRVGTNWFGIGAIEAYRVRFRDRVWPGDTLTATGEIADVGRDDGARTVTADLLVTNQDGDAVLTGETTARLRGAGDVAPGGGNQR